MWDVLVDFIVQTVANIFDMNLTERGAQIFIFALAAIAVALVTAFVLVR